MYKTIICEHCGTELDPTGRFVDKYIMNFQFIRHGLKNCIEVWKQRALKAEAEVKRLEKDFPK